MTQFYIQGCYKTQKVKKLNAVPNFQYLPNIQTIGSESEILDFHHPLLLKSCPGPNNVQSTAPSEKAHGQEERIRHVGSYFSNQISILQNKKKFKNYIFDNQKIKNNFPFLTTEASNFQRRIFVNYFYLFSMAILKIII